MNIEATIDGARATLALDGRLDTATAAELTKAVEELPEDVRGLTLAMDALSYVSSAGLRALLLAHKSFKAKGGELKLAGVSPVVLEILELTGFTGILNIES